MKPVTVIQPTDPVLTWSLWVVYAPSIFQALPLYLACTSPWEAKVREDAPHT